MRKLVVFAKYWLPLILWLALIFTASGDTQSFNNSSRLIGPLVKWLLPHLTAAQVDHTVFLVRKCAHATEYAVLAWLLWRTLRHHFSVPPKIWSRRVAWLAWLGATIYAATDELHQCFVPRRQGSVWDVLLDALGALLGVGMIWIIGRCRRFW